MSIPQAADVNLFLEEIVNEQGYLQLAHELCAPSHQY